MGGHRACSGSGVEIWHSEGVLVRGPRGTRRAELGVGWVGRGMITEIQLPGRVKGRVVGVDIEAGDGWVFTGGGIKGWKPGYWRGLPPSCRAHF